jgi:hypothetical protein
MQTDTLTGQPAEKVTRGFTIWKPSDFVSYVPPADTEIMGETSNAAKHSYWRDGEVALLVGPGGVGKSRLLLQMAICQILQRDFIGFTMFGPPRRWLLLGNENSALRLKDEVSAMTSHLPNDHMMLLEEYLRIQPVVDDSSRTVSLDDGEARARLITAAGEHRPDILCVDPWEAFILEGDCNDSRNTRASIGELLRIFRPFSERFSLLVVHHAREGAQAARMAEGYDAGAFLKGSKTLRSMARFMINVAPGDAEKRAKIVVSCGKSNNGPNFTSRGAELQPTTMSYLIDDDFDLNSWRLDVEGKRGQKACSIRDLVEAVRSGHSKTRAIVAAVGGKNGASESAVKRRMKDAEAGGYLSRVGTGVYELGPKGRVTSQASHVTDTITDPTGDTPGPQARVSVSPPLIGVTHDTNSVRAAGPTSIFQRKDHNDSPDMGA